MGEILSRSLQGISKITPSDERHSPSQPSPCSTAQLGCFPSRDARGGKKNPRESQSGKRTSADTTSRGETKVQRQARRGVLDKRAKTRGWIRGKWSRSFCETFPFGGDIIPSVRSVPPSRGEVGGSRGKEDNDGSRMKRWTKLLIVRAIFTSLERAACRASDYPSDHRPTHGIKQFSEKWIGRAARKRASKKRRGRSMTTYLSRQRRFRRESRNPNSS